MLQAGFNEHERRGPEDRHQNGQKYCADMPVFPLHHSAPFKYFSWTEAFRTIITLQYNPGEKKVKGVVRAGSSMRTRRYKQRNGAGS